MSMRLQMHVHIACIYSHSLHDALPISVRAWFNRRFPDGPTEAQAGGWPAIVAGQHTLICAPTGSGKTLAGFLAGARGGADQDRKSTRLNSSHTVISYAVFCLKKKNKNK